MNTNDLIRAAFRLGYQQGKAGTNYAEGLEEAVTDTYRIESLPYCTAERENIIKNRIACLLAGSKQRGTDADH